MGDPSLNRLLLAALAAAVGAGCTPSGERLRAELLSGSRPGRYLPLEFVRQEPNRCGSAALAEVLGYWGAPRSSETELAAEVYSPGMKGSLNSDLAEAARRRGLVVRDGRSSLLELYLAVESGCPAVAMITLSPHLLGRRHFLSVKGVDSSRGYLMADDGRRRDAVLRPRPFRRDWKCSGNWALYCWPADRAPAWASPAEEVQAGLLLEGRGQAEAAAAAYRRALDKDARLWEAEFNLGNLELVRSRPAEAEAHYRRALELQPGEPDTLNNLACALLASGRDLAGAEDAARRALAASPGRSAARVRSAHTLGLVLAALGRAAEARLELRLAAELADGIGEPGLAVSARRDLAKIVPEGDLPPDR